MRTRFLGQMIFFSVVGGLRMKKIIEMQKKNPTDIRNMKSKENVFSQRDPGWRERNRNM